MPPTARPHHALLLAILLLATGLRFTALGWGLRHTPHVDERYFVENVGWMLHHGDLDHRFYEYPGLFFYLLAPVLASHAPPHFGPDAYLAARAVVAGFGVLSVGLVYTLGARLAGRTAGLVAALLTAVSPVEVQTAHMVRPDVALESLVLLGMLALLRVGAPARGDVLAGAAVGAASALKFTGVLLAPSYVVKRLLTPGWRWQRLLLAGAVSILVFALLSPYSVLHFEGFTHGLRKQVGYHYVERGRGPQAFLGMAFTYLVILGKAFGGCGLALVALGALVALRDWRCWLPLLILPITMIGVFSTAEVQHDRFLVPTLGVLAVFAGSLIQQLRARSLAVAAALAVLAAGPPLLASTDYLRGIREPGAADLALDWIHASVPAGARVVSSLPDLGLDRSAYEVLDVRRIDARAENAALLADLVVAGPADDAAVLGRLRTLHRAEARTAHGGPPIFLLQAAPNARPRLTPVPIHAAWLTASEDAEALPLLLDGEIDKPWIGRQPKAWLEVRFPTPVRVARLELMLRLQARSYEPSLSVLATADGESWAEVAAEPGRPPLMAQLAGPGPSQMLLLEPRSVRGLRVVRDTQRDKAWKVSELRIEAAE